MNIAILSGLLVGLFTVIAIAEPVAKRFRLPNALVLAIAGSALGIMAATLSSSTLATEMGWQLQRVLQLRIPSELFLALFLPALIFQVALSLDIRRMMEDWLPIFIMAVLAVALATVTVGFVLTPVSGLSIYTCLLIGAIVSTTDPSAVIDIFKSISAPPRLVRIIQGESLLNDATAIALFAFFMAFVTAGVPNPKILPIFVEIPQVMLGGLLVGWVLARLAVPLMAVMGTLNTAQISLSIGLPFAAFLAAEYLGVSGVIATFAAGLILNLSGPSRLTPQGWKKMRETWDLLAHWAGALIFLLAALLIPRLLQRAEPWDALLVIIVILAALGSRAVMLWLLLPLLERLRLSPPIGHAYRAAILWGGLRGAVTLALALAVTEAPLVPADVKHAVGIIATGYVLTTLVLQGLTLRPLIHRLGLDRLSAIEQALSSQVLAVALQQVRETVTGEIRERSIDHDIVRSEAKRLGDITQDAVTQAEAAEEVLDRERVTLGLIALAGREFDLVMEALNEGRISTSLYETMIVDAARLLENARTKGRSGYRAAARKSIDPGFKLRLAVLLHRYLKISNMLSRVTSRRFEVLIAQRGTIEDLHHYIDGRIRRIHGKRVSDILHEVLSKREEGIASLLDGLRLQYPGYSEKMLRRWIRRMALRVEKKEYETLLADNLIDPDLHKNLMARIDAEVRTLDKPIKIDLTTQKDVLLRSLDIFKDLDDTAIHALSRVLHVRYVEPGEVLLRKEDMPRSVLLIGSGAIQVSRKTGSYMLGQGDFFGHFSLLTRAPRHAEMKAISHGTLFELEEKRFKKLVRSNTILMEKILRQAERLGIEIDKSHFE